MAGEAALLAFRVLGEFDVAQAGQSLRLGSHQQQALLLALLLEQGRPVGTEAIVHRLWGDEPPPGAVPTVHSYVSRLRKLLPADGAALHTTPSGYRLVVERSQVDAFVFEDLATTGRRALVAGDLASADKALSDALGLWRGPCLPEFADHPVAQATIDRLDALRVLAVEDATDVALTLGRHESVISDLERLVTENPFRERMWAQLVLALYRADRQAEALGRLREVRGQLADQLGVEPGPSLRRLEAQVLQQDPALELPTVTVQQAPITGVADPDAPPSPWRVDIPYVGRTRELEVATSMLVNATGGHGGIITITGEPGIGKTALAQQIAGIAHDQGCVVLWAQCPDSRGAPALWPWLQVLRSVRDQVGIPPDPALHTLSSLLSEDVAVTTSAGTAPGRFALGQAVATLFASISRDRPVLLVIDDAHWADAASLELLQVVAERAPRQSLLMVVTHRNGPESEPLTPTLAALARGAHASTLELDGLDETDIHLLLEASGDAIPGLAGSLWGRTEGNPYFLGEVMQSVRTGPHPASEATVMLGPVPPGVRDVLRARLLELPPDVLELLAIAAILGRECQMAVLAEAARMTRERCVTLVEPAIAAGILTTAGPGLSTLRFAHTLVHETVLENLSPVRTARLHARCAQVLMDRFRTASDAAEPIAHHVLASSGLVPAELAVPAVTGAADVALSRAAYEVGDRLLAGATDLILDLPSSSERDALELGLVLRRLRLRLLIRGYGVTDLLGLARRARELSGHATSRLGDLAEALAAAAITAVTAGDRVLAHQVTREALELVADSPDLFAHHTAHQAAARVAFNTGQIATARTELATCVDLARRAEDAQGRSTRTRADTSTPVYFTFGLAAFTAWIAGYPEAASRYLQECVSRAELTDDPVARQLARYFDAWIAAWNGDFKGSLRTIQRSLNEPEDAQSPYFRHAARVLSSWSSAHLRDPAISLADIDSALSDMLATNAIPWASYALALRAEILLLTGDLDAARHAVADARDRVIPPLLAEPYIAEIFRIHGQILIAEPSSLSEGLKVLHAGIGLAQKQGAGGFEQRLQSVLDQLS